MSVAHLQRVENLQKLIEQYCQGDSFDSIYVDAVCQKISLVTIGHYLIKDNLKIRYRNRRYFTFQEGLRTNRMRVKGVGGSPLESLCNYYLRYRTQNN